MSATPPLDSNSPAAAPPRRLTARRLLAAVAVLAAAIAVPAVAARWTRATPDGPHSPASAAAVAPSTAPGIGDARRVVLGVSGMYCTSCERTVTAMLARSAGVVRAVVSVDRGEAVILYDPARTTPAALAAVVERLGYRASIKAT